MATPIYPRIKAHVDAILKICDLLTVLNSPVATDPLEIAEDKLLALQLIAEYREIALQFYSR